jgi:hypothetical protein
MLILEGQAGGNHYNNKGGGSNYLCLPNDPDKLATRHNSSKYIIYLLSILQVPKTDSTKSSFTIKKGHINRGK